MNAIWQIGVERAIHMNIFGFVKNFVEGLRSEVPSKVTALATSVYSAKAKRKRL